LLMPVSDFVRRELELCGVEGQMEVQTLEPVPDWSHEPLPARESDEINFLCVGRLVEGKGVDVLIDSFSRIATALPDATLTIAGDGPKRRELERRAKRSNAGSRIRFIGHVPHSSINEVYERSDIVVFPSTYPESTGRSALEAAMVGRPVIAARSGGLVEVIGQERGVLVRPGDVEELAREMIALANDRERRARLAGAAREFASRFTSESLRAELLGVYERFLPPSFAIGSERRTLTAHV
jgi:glycosyltransferase involved in cell wall biosynthesis